MTRNLSKAIRIIEIKTWKFSSREESKITSVDSQISNDVIKTERTPNCDRKIPSTKELVKLVFFTSNDQEN